MRGLYLALAMLMFAAVLYVQAAGDMPGQSTRAAPSIEAAVIVPAVLALETQEVAVTDWRHELNVVIDASHRIFVKKHQLKIHSLISRERADAACLEVSAVQRCYKPVAAGQYNGDDNFSQAVFSSAASGRVRLSGSMNSTAFDLTGSSGASVI